MANPVYEALILAGPGPHNVVIPEGVVTIEEMTVTLEQVPVGTDPDTGETVTSEAVVVEVLAPYYTDPHIRIINPPRYRPDPNGTIELGLRRWVDDPLGAVAHLVLQYGGTRVPRQGTT